MSSTGSTISITSTRDGGLERLDVCGNVFDVFLAEHGQNVVLNYTFRKPSSVTVHVNAGPNAGVTMRCESSGMTIQPSSAKSISRK
jgi:hypothetical protein